MSIRISGGGSGSGGGSIGGTITGGTDGSVLFIHPANTLAQDNANFFWDSTNHFLGIGTSSPAVKLQINGASGSPANSGTTSTALFRIDPVTKGAMDFGVLGTVGWIQSYTSPLTDLSTHGLIAINPNGGFVSVGNNGSSFGTQDAALIVYGQDATSSNFALKVKSSTPADLFVVRDDGSVGIGTTSPGALLDIGLAGTTLGTLRLEGSTSGYVQLQTDVAAGSWTMTLPTSGGTNGYSLTTNGSGVTSWTNVSGGGSGLTIGTSTITSGTDTRILYDNSGVVGEYTITGTGTVVAMKTSPTFVTPALGAATYTTLVGGNITDSALTAGRVTFAGTSGILQDDSDMTFSGDTLTVTKIIASTNLVINSGTALTTTNQTGTGNIVLATSPTLTTAVLGSSTATTQTSNDNSTKVATTAYVDNAVLGQDYKEAAGASSTANVVGTYLNGSSGVGATFTYTATGVDTLDGVSLTIGMRVLLKNQTSSFQNGIYTVTTAGAIGIAGILTRAVDFDQTADIKTGDAVFITAGTVNLNTTWAVNSADSPVMGTDAITFAQTAGPGSITLSGDVTSVGNVTTVAKIQGTTVSGTSGSGNVAFTTSPTFTTPTIGVATATSINKVAFTAPTTAATFAFGTDNTTQTFQGTDTIVGRATTDTLTNKTLTSPTMTAPVLGTPASGTLTNCTGLPAASVLAGSLGAGAFVISTSLQVATIELGAATDTTLSRVSAGVIAVEGVTIVDVSSSQTLTNKSIVASQITAGTFASGSYSFGTGNPVTLGTIELGAASDTTLSRSSGGVLAVEGVVIPSISSTNTLTNKRITKRVGTTTSSATPTINTDNVDYYSLTAQTADITSFTTNLSGTPTDAQTLWISVTGTAARAITWGSSFESSTMTLPTTTVSTARLDVGFVWNIATSKWRCVATA